MNENTRKGIIFATLFVIWGSLITHIMSGSLGLAAPVFPRPQPDIELVAMLLSGLGLAGYSLKIGINYIKSK